MTTSPYQRDIERFTVYSAVDTHWRTTAVLGPIASIKLRAAVRRARELGAVVSHVRTRKGLLTRYHRLESYGEGAQLHVLPATLARLLSGRA